MRILFSLHEGGQCAWQVMGKH